MQKTSPFDSPVVALCILHIYRLLFNPSLCNNVGDKVSNSYKEMNFPFIFSISKNAVYEKWKKFTVWVFLLRRSLCHNQLVDGIRSKALYILSWLEVLFLYHSQKRLGHFNPFSSAFWLTLHLKRIHLCRHVKLWRDGEIVCILQFVFVMDACAWLHKVRPQWIINHLGGPVCNLCLIYFLSGVDGVWLCDQLLQVFLLEWAFNRT